MERMRTRFLHRIWGHRTLGAICLAGLVLALACVPTAPSEQNRNTSSSQTTNDKGWLVAVQQQIDAQEYRPTKQMLGLQGEKLSEPMWHIDNRAQGFRSAVSRAGWEIIPRTPTETMHPKDPTKYRKEAYAKGDEDPKWSWRYRFAGLSRGDAHTMLPSPAVRNENETVYLTYSPSVSEWYRNSKAGIEQGFELQEKPHAKGKEELILVGELTTDLAVLNPTRERIGFSKDGVEFVQYSGLKVLDASGKTIPSWLSYSEKDREQEIMIHIDDSAAVYPLLVDPLATSASWIGESNQYAANYGYSVSSAGDVNQDGYSDVLVSAVYFDNGEENEGQVYLHLGSASGLSTVASWMGESNQINGWFGSSVSTAGDVNGDGYSDVLVGSSGFNNGETQEGVAHLYLGSSSGLAATASWTMESDQIGALFGNSLGAAGDVNGDGYADVVVGAPFFDNGQTDTGQVYLYMGSPSGLSTTASWSGGSDQLGALYGVSVSTAGDVNGDGYADVVVGVPRFDNGETDKGMAVLYLGSASGLSTAPDWTVEASQDLTGYTFEAEFGFSVSTAGDVNGDGFSDVIVGARTFPSGGVPEGRAFLYLGSGSGLSTSASWVGEPNQTNAWYGYSVSSAGDVNGDGFADVMVGASHFSNGEVQEGSAFLYLGSAGGLSTVATWTGESNQVGAEYGHSVSSAGDINNDAASDVIIGAHWAENGEGTEGRAYPYLGILDATPTPTHTPTSTATPTSTPTPQGGELATATPTPTPVVIAPGQKNLPPPQVQVVGDDITVTMPQVTPRLTGKALTKAMKLLMARGLTKQQATKALKNLVVTYVLKISKIGAASVNEIDALGNSAIIRSRNNQISQQNLAPGNYSSSYTIQISTKKPLVPLGSTGASQSTTFRVP